MVTIRRKTMGRGRRPRRAASAAEKTMTQAPSRTAPRKKRAAVDYIIPAIVICLLAGVICGSIYANALGGDEYLKIKTNIGNVISGAGLSTANGGFIETFIKYGKIPVIIWFLAFFPPSFAVTLILVFVKGMGVGFTTALIMRIYGAGGIFYSSMLYFTQNIFIITAYIYVAYESLKFAANSVKIFTVAPGGRRGGLKSKISAFAPAAGLAPGRLTEYFISLAGTLVCVFIASAVEIYLTPLLF